MPVLFLIQRRTFALIRHNIRGIRISFVDSDYAHYLKNPNINLNICDVIDITTRNISIINVAIALAAPLRSFEEISLGVKNCFKLMSGKVCWDSLTLGLMGIFVSIFTFFRSN